MHKRPVLFVVVGILHLLEPLVKILWLKMDSGMEFSLVISNVFSMEGAKNLFDFWMLFPLAGIAILSVKEWSYLLFMGLQIYSVFSHLTYQKYTWPYVAERPFVYSMFLLAFNIGLLLYFSLPKVRRPFFDRRMRWWEAKPRYGAEIPCQVSIVAPNSEVTSTILNISQTGAFISWNQGMEKGQKVKLIFNHHDFSFSLNATIVNRHTSNGIDGMGVEFHFADFKEAKAMRKYIKKLSSTFKNSYELNTA